jgi:flagellar motor protein MotB
VREIMAILPGVPRQENKEIQVGKPLPLWLLTYADLMTEILIFFVMMFALFSAMNELQLINLKRELETYVREQEWKG